MRLPFLSQATWGTDGKRIKISVLAAALKNHKPRTWPDINLDGVPCALSLKRLSDKDLLAVVSFGLTPSDDPLGTHRQRWAIELCFACMKTKGFDIESTHLRHDDRLGKMFAIVMYGRRRSGRVKKRQRNPDRQAQKPNAKKNTATTPDPSSSVA